MTAVGKRFSGTYNDENDGHQVIPRVFVWAIGNEPNQGGWLTPQWEHGKLASPRLYRSLYFAARARARQDRPRRRRDLRRRDRAARAARSARRARRCARSCSSTQLLCAPGPHATAAAATSTSSARCRPRRGRITRTRRRSRRCSATRTPTRSRWPTSTSCRTLLDALSAQTGHIGGGLPIVSTEFGYETNPPDKYVGISLDKQADYITLGDYITYLNPRIAGNTQFLLRDVPPLRKYPKTSRHYWFTYQSGILTRSGKAKPSAQAYAMPLPRAGDRHAAAGERVGPAAFPTQQPSRRSSGPGADRVQASRRIGRLGAAGQPDHRDQRPRLLHRPGHRSRRRIAARQLVLRRRPPTSRPAARTRSHEAARFSYGRAGRAPCRRARDMPRACSARSSRTTRRSSCSSATIRERTLDDLQTLGVDTVHSVVFWNKVSPSPLSTHRPSGFDGSNPAAYPANLWDRYDGLVRGAQARGMDVLLRRRARCPPGPRAARRR